MNYSHRQLSKRIVRLAQNFPVVVLSGARQVGKSTLLAHTFPALPIVTFDPAQDVGGARKDPDLFLDTHPAPIILDEIQYAPELVAAIKRRVDRTHAPGQYILTGSQQWAVLKTAGESLAGRAVFLDLEGFSLAEIAYPIADQDAGPAWLARYLDDPQGFLAKPCPRLPPSGRTVYEQLFRGFLPRANFLALDLLKEFHASYITTYIERDARVLMQADDWQLFGQFVQLVSALSAQEINNSHLGRELGITPQTARRWVMLLRDTFQWHEIPAYHTNAVKRASGKAKGYFSDTGLVCALQRISSPQALAGHPITGALFETAVAAEIRKQNTALGARLHHWRSFGGAEIDLLLERDGLFFPIEVKLNSRPDHHATRGITAFRAANPQLKIAPGLVIAPAAEKAHLNPTVCVLPWDAR